MAYREITKYPERVLRKKAREVEEITPEIQRLIDDMIETMYKANGVGLAAPQVALSLRLIIADTPKGALPVINPEIVEVSDEKITEDEGCLSVPGYFFKIPRAKKVRVRGLTREGREIELEAEGLVARIFQHEVDHLDGKLVLNRIGFFKRLRVLPEILKKAKRGWQ